MKRIATILILTLSFCQLNSQDLVDTTKQWSTVIHRLPTFTIITENIKFQGDTIIDFIDYKKVFRSTDEFQTIWEPYGYIRETSDKKVYFRMDTTSDLLIYDFDLGLYDLVEVYGIAGFGSSSDLSPMTFMVSNIDSVLLGGVYRDQFHMNPVFSGDTFPDASEFWIEGMGSKSGILHWEAFLVGGDSYELLCHSENETLIYQNSAYTSCYYFWTDLTEIINDHEIKIYPNPFIDKATVMIENYDVSKIYVLEIFDGFGRQVFRNNIESHFILGRNDIKSGICVFRIVCDGEPIKTVKIMIQE